MTVYVDDARIPAKVGNLDRRWSHLMADTPEELHAFAAQLGLKRAWFQDHRPYWHYDVTDGLRQRALALGAQPVTSREAVSLPHWQREPSPPLMLSRARRRPTRGLLPLQGTGRRAGSRRPPPGITRAGASTLTVSRCGVLVPSAC